MTKKTKRGKKKVDDFAHLHVHSHHSLLDGAAKMVDYVKVAAKRNNPAIAFTDHGTMRGYLEHHKACGEHEIKPLYGTEFYVSRNAQRKGVTAEEKAELTKGKPKNEHKQAIKAYEDEHGIRDRWHTTALAMNQEGLQNLMRLNSRANIEGYYYKPRVDAEMFAEHSEGLIVTTGCLSGPVNELFLAGKRKQAIQYARRMHEIFGDRYYVELHPHAIDEQAQTNRFGIELCEMLGIEPVACQDAHYVKHEHHCAHDALLCLGTNAKITDADRFRFPGDEFYFRKRSQMRDAFEKYHSGIKSSWVKRALDNTLVVAERCSAKVEIDYQKVLLPPIELPKGYKGGEKRYLRDLCLDGWTTRGMAEKCKKLARKRGITMDAARREYANRLRYELGIICDKNFQGYFLILRDLMLHAKQQKILVGPGRGSGGGSLINYLLGITAIDPIEHDLMFERFLNPDRVDMPDVDLDFDSNRRDEMFTYLGRKYGEDRVARISTNSKMRGKAVLKDMARVHGVPYSVADKVVSSLIERPDGHPRQFRTVADSVKQFRELKEFAAEYPDIVEHAIVLEGLAKTCGIHPAGVVVAPVPVSEICPLESRSPGGGDRLIVTAVDMNEVASLGLVKLDLLGLTTLAVMAETLKEIERRHGVRLDMEQVELNDKKVLQRFTDHDLTGVFQYDTGSARALVKGLTFNSFADIAALTAVNRPGTTRSGLAEKYIARRKDPSKIEVDYHEIVNKICEETYGVMIYQEQVLKVFVQMAGFTPGRADLLRKAIGKKQMEVIKAARDEFVEGSKKKVGCKADAANKLFTAIEAHGSYSFNMAHSVGYGMLAYWGQWLKTYYELEFYNGLFRQEKDSDAIRALAKDLRKRGIPVLPPHVDKSSHEMTIDDEHGGLRSSLTGITGVGSPAAQAIGELQPFKDFADFYKRVPRRVVNRGSVTALVKAGAMDGLISNRRYFVEEGDKLYSALALRSKLRDQRVAEWNDAESKYKDYSREEAQIIRNQVSPFGFDENPVSAYVTFVREYIKFEPNPLKGPKAMKAYDGKFALVIGVKGRHKIHQTGDFDANAHQLTEAERRRKFYGTRFATVDFETSGGHSARARFDIDTCDKHIEIVTAKVNSPIAVFGQVDEKFNRIKVSFAVNLEVMRRKLRSVEDGQEVKMNLWERVLMGDGPHERLQAKKGWFRATVTNVRLRYDRKDNLMCFVGLMGSKQFYDATMFSSTMREMRQHPLAGDVVYAKLEKADRGHVCQAMKVKWRLGEGSDGR